MKLSSADLRYLSLPALVALVVILAGVGTVIVSQNFMADANADLERAKAERAAIQTKLLRATEEEREIRASLVNYQSMRERGIIGEEHRLDWVETVKDIKNQRGLYGLRYEIAAQRPLEYPGFKSPAGIEFLDSRMKLQADLLHEGDLFDLLADLRARFAPFVIVRSCTVERNAAARPDAYGPHVKADCELDLVTIRDTAEAAK